MGVRFAKQCQQCDVWTKKMDRLKCKRCGSSKFVEHKLTPDSNFSGSFGDISDSKDDVQDAQQMLRVYEIFKQIIEWEPCVNNLFANFSKVGLSPHECFEFLRACEFKEFSSGTPILHKNDRMFCIFFVASPSDKLPLYIGSLDGKHSRTTWTTTRDTTCLCLTATRYAGLISILGKFSGAKKRKRKFALLLRNLRRSSDAAASSPNRPCTAAPAIVRRKSYNYNMIQNRYHDTHLVGGVHGLLIARDNFTAIFHGMQSIPHSGHYTEAELQLVVALRKLCLDEHVVRLWSVVWAQAGKHSDLFRLTMPDTLEPARVHPVGKCVGVWVCG